ncbi:asparaginase, partial [Chryseobacterium mucoviscidosis]
MKTAKQNSLKSIAQKAFDYLKTNSAFDTVAYAVSLLEDDELYNAGIGSQIQSDGVIRMSAAIMDGETQKLSGVINI